MDVEQMYAAASEEYKNNYSTGEYCHKQSFLWGFQEGVELAEANSGKELLYVAQKTVERTKKEIINKACEWLKENIDLYAYNSFSRKSGYPEIKLTEVFETAFKKAMEE